MSWAVKEGTILVSLLGGGGLRHKPRPRKLKERDGEEKKEAKIKPRNAWCESGVVGGRWRKFAVSWDSCRQKVSFLLEKC